MKTILVSVFILIASSSIYGQEEVDVFGYKLKLHKFEEVPADEPLHIWETLDVFKDFFKTQYGKNPMRRGVHPKTHGCYEGKMVMNSNIPQVDQVGIFTPNKEYDIFLRFSNGGPRPNNIDTEADTRGIGIQVRGIEGKNLLPLAKNATQDFTLNSSGF